LLNIMRGYIAITVLITAIMIFDAPAYGKIAIMVSIAPQKYFVQQICKELADVQVMVPPATSPATYEPKPRQMAASEI